MVWAANCHRASHLCTSARLILQSDSMPQPYSVAANQLLMLVATRKARSVQYQLREQPQMHRVYGSKFRIFGVSVRSQLCATTFDFHNCPSVQKAPSDKRSGRFDATPALLASELHSCRSLRTFSRKK